MTEKFKNLSFPVKFGLALLVFPLACVICAYLYNFSLDLTCRAEISGCEMEELLPFFLVFAAELPFSLPLTRWLASQGGDLYWLLGFMYPGRYLLLTILPALALWFLIGYLIGKICTRFSPKIQKGILVLLVGVPTICLLLFSLNMLLGTLNYGKW